MIAPRLERPPAGIVRDGRRCVHLRGAMQVSVQADGRGLDATWSEMVTTTAPVIHADLSCPVSQLRWPAAFERSTGNACAMTPLAERVVGRLRM